MFKIVKCKDYNEETIRKALKKTVNFREFVKKEDKVLIKPNLLMAANPDRLITTNPALVKEIIRELNKIGAHIIVADSPGGPYNERVLKRLYEETGYDDLKKVVNFELNYDNSTYELKNPSGFIKRYKIIKVFDEVDKVINVPKLKTHMLTTLSCATKNLFGLIPGTEKVSYHGRFKELKHFSKMITDLAMAVTEKKPTLNIVDAVIGMEGEGPSNGTGVNLGLLIIGDNIFEVDYNISKIIDIPYETIPYLNDALTEGFFRKSKKDFKKYRKSFKKPHSSFLASFWDYLPAFLKNLVSNYWIKKPVINKEVCIGCGDCMRACPVKAIKIKDKKASINYKKCVRCYCCHELCKYKSVDLQKRII